MTNATSSFIVRSVNQGKFTEKKDILTAEEPLEIEAVSGEKAKTVAVTMRTPGHDSELGIGFLLSEGLIHFDTTVEIQELSDANRVSLGLHEKDFLKIESSESLNRYSFVNSSCGICGRTSIEDLREKGFHAIDSDMRVDAKRITELPDIMRSAQQVFERTGGLHAAGLFSAEGQLLCLREDIGRHNAVDKVLGWVHANKIGFLRTHILLVSGRLSYEIVQKALSAGIPIICAVSAPSNLAVKVAHEFNMTLIGFLRGQQFNIYTYPERIVGVQ